MINCQVLATYDQAARTPYGTTDIEAQEAAENC